MKRFHSREEVITVLKKIKEVYWAAWALTAESRKTLFLLLLVVTLFKVEVPLVIPYIIRWIYEAIAVNSIQEIIWATVRGGIIFSINVVLMYFVNVYGDSWAMKLAFDAAKSSFIRTSKLAVSDIKKQYGNADVFNRIVSGTGQIVGLWFTTMDVLSSVIATMIILYIFSRQTVYVFAFVVLLVIVDVLRAVFSYFKIAGITLFVEKKRINRIGYLKSFVENHTFHLMNDSIDYIAEKYHMAREEYFSATVKKINLTAFFDAISDVIHNIFIVVLGNSYYELKRENQLSMAEINSSYNLFLSMKDTVNTLVRSVINFSGKIVPIERLNQLILKDNEEKTANNGELYSVENLSFSYQDKPVLTNVTIRMNVGEKVAIIGDNGCGKSTLLKCMAGILGQENGRNRFYNDITYLPADLFLFQSQSVYRNLCMGNPMETDEGVALLSELGMVNSTDMIAQNCTTLSGGEKQRVALLRSYVRKSKVLLWDEPTSSLDAQSVEHVKNLLNKMKSTIVYVTHSPELAKMADKIYIMKDGRIMSCVTKENAEKDKLYQEWLNRKEE